MLIGTYVNIKLIAVDTAKTNPYCVQQFNQSFYLEYHTSNYHPSVLIR